MTQHERRKYSRKTLNPLPYINLPSGNGGIVLDVSEQGLRFRATAPVDQSGPIHFWFTANSNLVTGIGELMWFDQAKKTGGLRFTELPYNALEQIRKWPHNSSLRPNISEDLTLHIPAPDGSASLSKKEGRARATLQSKVAFQFYRLLPDPFKSKVRKIWIPELRNALAKLRTLSPQAHLQKHNRWLFKATYGLLLVMVISTLVYLNRRGTGELLIRMGTRLSGGINTLAPASTVASLDSRVDDAAAYNSKLDAPAPQALSQSTGAAAAKTANEIPPDALAPQARRATAQLPKAEAPGRELIVQVAALKEEVDARKLADLLQHGNFQAFVGTLPADSLYRVMLGPYADAASARAVVGKLKTAGFSSFIRREPTAERLASKLTATP
jgi:cell division septation protein DedD